MFHSSSASPDGLLLGLPRCHARPCKWESDRPGDTFPLASSRRLDFNVLFPTPSVMNSRLQRAREQGQVSFVPGPPGGCFVAVPAGLRQAGALPSLLLREPQ